MMNRSLTARLLVRLIVGPGCMSTWIVKKSELIAAEA